MTDDASRVFRPPNTLSAKVTKGGPGAVSLATLEKAEQVISDLATNYLEWVEDDLKRLQAAFADLKSGTGEQSEALNKIFELVHDMKGQGGTFGYNLMTVIGDQLCRYIEGLKGKASEEAMEVIQLHIDALQVVISQNLSADGGAVGIQLLQGLEQVMAKRSG
jgi:chemotaxis protein histidine kinase CheA